MITFLVQIYIIVFIIIMLVSFVYFIKDKMHESYINKKIKTYINKEKVELCEINKSKIASSEHIKYLSKQLLINRNLQAFDSVLTYLKDKDENELCTYIYSITQVFTNIVKKYYRKPSIYKSYFAYLIAKYDINLNVDLSKIKEFLLSICDSNSLYSRENSLLALANLGAEKEIVEALNRIVIKKKNIHVKLLTECFASFKGDHNKLLNLLWSDYKKFPNEIKVSIINYARLINEKYCENVYSRMVSETNEEVVYACLRYFGKNIYQEALPYMLDLGNEAFEKEKWGYVAVISSTLKNYRCEDSIKFLYKAIACPDWSSRENAAKTLIHFYGDNTLSIIEKLQDKYAKEMVEYQMNVNKIRTY